MKTVNLAPLPSYLFTFLLFYLSCGCSSSDEDKDNGGGTPAANATFSASEMPEWHVDLSGNEQKPQWTAPDPSQYESKMIFLLRLQKELVPFSTDDDVMGVFVDDQCRALSQRSGNEQKVFFVLNVHGNNTATPENYQLRYYSGGLKRLFVLSGQNTLLNERSIGIDSDFSPMLTAGQTKFSVMTELTVDFVASDDHPVYAEEDLVGVFVNGECRGVGKPGDPFLVFSNSTDEQGELRYYSIFEGGVFTSSSKVLLSGGSQTIPFNF